LLHLRDARAERWERQAFGATFKHVMRLVPQYY
jgi:hypothetical protein